MEKQEQREDIALPLFGGDHWKMFLQVFKADDEESGVLDISKMRIAYSKRSSFEPHRLPEMAMEYPTQIKTSPVMRSDGRYGVKKVAGHDDIDCLSDLERVDLVEAHIPNVENDRFVTPEGKVVTNSAGEPLDPFLPPEELEQPILKETRWSLTAVGMIVAAELEDHVDAGQTLHSFQPVI